MMNRVSVIRICAVLALSSLLSGCGDPPPPEENHVLEDYNRAMERAEATEQQVMDAARRQREQIDAQSGEG